MGSNKDRINFCQEYNRDGSTILSRIQIFEL